MKTFNRIIFVWCAFVTILNAGVILMPDAKHKAKQEAAFFGGINCLCMYFLFDKAWGKEEKKKPQA